MTCCWISFHMFVYTCCPTLFFCFNVVLAILSLLHFHVNLTISCQYSQNHLLGFQLGLHWIYRPNWEELTSWVFTSMRVDYLSIYLDLFKFFLSEFCNFPHIDLESIMLHLHPRITLFIGTHTNVCMRACWVTSFISDCLWPYRLKPARLLCPWDFPSENTGVGCHFLLQKIFPTRGSSPHLLCLLHWQVDSFPLAPPEKSHIYTTMCEIDS